MDNTCVCCGAELPEGRQICPGCESRVKQSDDSLDIWYDEETHTWKGVYKLEIYFDSKEQRSEFERFLKSGKLGASLQTGEWISDDYGYNHCSECGYELDAPEEVTAYCPGCGLRMNPEVNGDD